MVYPGQLHFTDFKAPIIPRAIDDPGRKLRVVMVGTGKHHSCSDPNHLLERC